MNHWLKIKVPNYGHSDGMVRHNSKTWIEEKDFCKPAPKVEWSWIGYDKSIEDRKQLLNKTKNYKK